MNACNTTGLEKNRARDPWASVAIDYIGVG